MITTQNACIFILIMLDVQYLWGHLVDEERMTVAECREEGFNSKSLKCSACRMLGQFNLEEIMTTCLRCCEDVKTEQERYPFAEMEVCECNLGRFPQVSAFVHSDMKDQWGGRLRVRQVRGVLPTIVLKSADRQTQKSLNIEKWDTNTITEYLNNVLQMD